MWFVIFALAAVSAVAGQFSTAVGDTYPYQLSAMTTDSAGNSYAAGTRWLSEANQPLSLTVTSAFPVDIFVMKLDADGKLVFTRTFDGDGSNIVSSIAVDSSGNIYVAGSTTSDDLPLTNSLQTTPCVCGFIVKLSGDGKTILYSTYFGGLLGTTSIKSIATDAKGNLYLTGTSNASDFPHTAGMPWSPLASSSTENLSGAIITSISAAGDRILYSGALAASQTAICFSDHGEQFCQSITSATAIAVDAVGNAYFAGSTDSIGQISANGFRAAASNASFVAKITAGGAGVSYLSSLGPAAANAIAVDTTGDVYVGGFAGPNFPTTAGVFQPGFVGTYNADGLVMKLSADGSTVLWATYLGGANGGGSAAVVDSIALDSAGNVWTTGLAASTTLPNQGWTTGDEFVAGLNPSGTKLAYSALYPRGTVAQAVAVDGAGLVHVAGLNGFVAALAPFVEQVTTVFGTENVFGAGITQRISPAEVIAIYGPGIGPVAAVTATPSNGFYPTTLATVQVTVNGVAAPLLYVSANQINAVVPMETVTGAAATIRVTNNTVSAEFPVWIIHGAPAAFPTVLNQDGTINSQSNPAKGGSIVTFYATGWQESFSPLVDGQVAIAAQDVCAGECSATSSTAVLYGGAAPGIVAGVTQFNVRVLTVQAASLYLVSLGENGSAGAPAANLGGTLSVEVWIAPSN